METFDEFQKNLQRIKVNNKNKNISKQLDNISSQIKELSFQLKNNINSNKTNVFIDPPPAGHTLPVTNNSHLHFSSTLRRFW